MADRRPATATSDTQDLSFLRMTPDELCRVSGCRVVDFMIHDRVAFGGSLMAVGLLYLWLTAFPLSRGEGWAWWTILVSGGLGFAGFLTYLGYGYLDTWHGMGTLLLAPLFAVGLARSRGVLLGDRRLRAMIRPPTRGGLRAAGSGVHCRRHARRWTR